MKRNNIPNEMINIYKYKIIVALECYKVILMTNVND